MEGPNRFASALVLAGALWAGAAGPAVAQANLPRILAAEDSLRGTEEQELRWPVATAAASAEEIAVADAFVPRLLVFRNVGASWQLDQVAELPGVPMALAHDGRRYVASLRGAQGLVALEGPQLLQRRIGLPRGVVPGPVAARRDGGLLVYDFAGGRVLRLNAEGDPVGETPVAGRVTALAAAPGGGFYTAVGDEAAIRRYDADGTLDATWKLPGEGPRAGLAGRPGPGAGGRADRRGPPRRPDPRPRRRREAGGDGLATRMGARPAPVPRLHHASAGRPAARCRPGQRPCATLSADGPGRRAVSGVAGRLGIGLGWILLALSAAGVSLAEEVRYLARLGLPNAEDSIGYPRAVAADPWTGEIFVCDTRKNRIVIFDHEGLFLYQIPGGRVFSAPADLAVDAEGYLFVVANHERHPALLHLDFDGLFLREVRLSGGPAGLVTPQLSSVAISPGGRRLYAVDRANLGLWVADRGGRASAFVDLAAGLSEKEKRDLILGKVDVYGDRVLLAVPSSGEIRVFGPDGAAEGRLGLHGTAPCQLAFPTAAAMDVEGNLVIVDQRRMIILRWTSEGNRCLGEQSGPGAVPGYLYYPMDIALDREGRAYVSQGYEGRVQVYGGFPAAALGAPPSAPFAREPDDPRSGAEEAVREWGRARAEQRADDCLAAYSAGFHPFEAGTREKWEALERDLMRAGAWTGSEINDLQVEIVRPGIARARFVELRDSDSADRRSERKTLVLRLEDGAWKILEERSEGSP